MTLVRDDRTKALLNTDKAALNKYKMDRHRDREMKRLSEELTEVKQTLASVCARIENIEKV